LKGMILLADQTITDIRIFNALRAMVYEEKYLSALTEINTNLFSHRNILFGI